VIPPAIACRHPLPRLPQVLRAERLSGLRGQFQRPA
jgi:hypothetical protein